MRTIHPPTSDDDPSGTSLRRLRPFRILGFCLLGLLLFSTAAWALPTSGGGDPDAVATRTDWFLMFFYVGLAVLVSFLCSVAEAVLLSVTPSYIQNLERGGKKGAKALKKLKADVDRPLAAILTINTIAHTFGAGGAGAKAELIFGSKWFGVAMIVLTLLILFASEIIPKTIGAVYWKKLAPITAKLIKFFIFIAFPFILISERLTGFLNNNKEAHSFNPEEFTAMADIGEQEGQVSEDESQVVQNLFRMREMSVEEVMTPRTVMFTLHREMTVDQVFGENENLQHSRIPLFNENRDDITGFVLKTDVLMQQAKDEKDTRLHELERPLQHVQDDVPLSDVFEKFLDDREHLFLVKGPYGGTSGIITLEDVVETLLGEEIVDEADLHDDLQKEARRLAEEGPDEPTGPSGKPAGVSKTTDGAGNSRVTDSGSAG